MVTDVPEPAPEEPWTTGYGYSPPARKLACLPFWASTLGSESTSTRPLASRAWMVAPRFKPGKNAKRFSSLDRIAEAGVVPLGRETVGGENCPVEIPLMVLPRPVLNRFIPSELLLLRSTLAKITLRRICGSAAGTSMLGRFTTLPAEEAIWTARLELLISLTVPLRKTAPFSELIFRVCPGNSLMNSRRIASRRSFDATALGRTFTLKNCRLPPFSQI